MTCHLSDKDSMHCRSLETETSPCYLIFLWASKNALSVITDMLLCWWKLSEAKDIPEHIYTVSDILVGIYTMSLDSLERIWGIENKASF